jgi:hypothetical protein
MRANRSANNDPHFRTERMRHIKQLQLSFWREIPMTVPQEGWLVLNTRGDHTRVDKVKGGDRKWPNRIVGVEFNELEIKRLCDGFLQLTWRMYVYCDDGCVGVVGGYGEGPRCGAAADVEDAERAAWEDGCVEAVVER